MYDIVDKIVLTCANIDINKPAQYIVTNYGWILPVSLVTELLWAPNTCAKLQLFAKAV